MKNTILECHIEMTGNDHPMLFLDEIHNIDGWDKFARRMADSKRTVWITGSNAKMLSKEIMTTLGGRYIPVEVYPFNFKEFLRSKNIPNVEETMLSTSGKSLLMREYAEYMNWGGLPDFAERETTSKYYFIDNGLLSLLLVDPTTTLLENMVALSLFRKYGNDKENERIFFYNQHVEVDFYIPDEELAIQVSYSMEASDTTERREVEALQKLPKALSCKRRVVITYDEEKSIEDKYGVIEVIPCWKWLLQL